MKMYIISFIYVSFILTIAYAIMKVVSEKAGENKKQKTVNFIIFFGICTLLYTFWWNTQNDYNAKIQDYLYKIEKSTKKIYNELDGTNLLDSVEDDLFDINQNIEEIYSIMNN